MSQEDKREQIRILFQVAKHKPKKISSILGVSLASVYNTLKKIKTGQNLSHQKGGGRKPLKSSAIENSLRQQIRRSFWAITLDEFALGFDNSRIFSQLLGIYASEMPDVARKQWF